MPSETSQFMIVSCKLAQPDSVLFNLSEEEKNSFSDADQVGASLRQLLKTCIKTLKIFAKFQYKRGTIEQFVF